MLALRAQSVLVLVMASASCAERSPTVDAADSDVSDAPARDLDSARSVDAPSEADAPSFDVGVDVVESDAADGSDVDGGTDAADCSWFPGKCGDPECVPLSCANANNYLKPSAATPSGSTLAVGFTWCGMCGDYFCAKAGTIELGAAQALDDWATVQSLELGCPFEVMLELAPGTEGGSLKVEGSISGLDVACAPLTCPIDKTFQVLRSDAGVWTISEP